MTRQAGLGAAGRGSARQIEAGEARRVAARPGEADRGRLGRRGGAGHGKARMGTADQGRQGVARLVQERPEWAWQIEAGEARHGEARQGTAGQIKAGRAGQGQAGQGPADRGRQYTSVTFIEEGLVGFHLEFEKWQLRLSRSVISNFRLASQVSVLW